MLSIIEQTIQSSQNQEELKEQFKLLRMEVTKQKNQNALLQLMQEDNQYFDKLFKMISIIDNDESLYLFYFQFWANFITANPQTKEYFLEQSLNMENELFRDKMLLQCQKSQKILKTCYVFCFNMIFNTNQSTRESILFKHPLVKQFFYFQVQMSNLVLQLICSFFKDGQSQFEEISLEWIAYLFQEIFSDKVNLQQSYLELLVNNSQNSKKLFSFIIHCLQKTLDEQKFPSLIESVNTNIYEIQQLYSKGLYKLGIQLHLSDILYLIKEFIDNANQIIKEIQNNQTKTELNKRMGTIQQSLQIFCLITFLGGFNEKVQNIFMDEPFIVNLELLIVLKELYDKNKLISLIDQEYYQDLFCLFLRFNGNLLHTNQKAQQRVTLEKRYYGCLLGFSRFDSNQVGLKECGVFIMKNLCENNEELRKMVQNEQI